MIDFTEPLAVLTAPVTDERPWMVFGACRDADADLFFPSTKDDARQAIAICHSCPVRIECLEYALEARERFGIWGGTTDRDRRRLLRTIA